MENNNTETKKKYTETHRRCVKEWKLKNADKDKIHQQRKYIWKKEKMRMLQILL